MHTERKKLRGTHPPCTPTPALLQEYLPIVKEEPSYDAVERNTSGSRPKELFQVTGLAPAVPPVLPPSCALHAQRAQQRRRPPKAGVASRQTEKRLAGWGSQRLLLMLPAPVFAIHPSPAAWQGRQPASLLSQLRCTHVVAQL